MFWRVAGFTQPSPVETILDKEAFTVEELLEEDDLIQECKSLNGRLIGFLQKKSTLQTLIKYLVEPAPESESQNRRFKYPFAACEVFCCEVDAIFSALLGDDELMASLLSLLGTDQPLDCVAAGYFARVVTCLLVKRTAEVMRYLQAHTEVLGRLVAHVDTTSVAEVLACLTGADEGTALHIPPQQLEWLAETELVAELLGTLRSAPADEARKNAAAVLAAIARSPTSPLARNLIEDAILGQLLEAAFMPHNGRVSMQALDVSISLLETKAPPPDLQQSQAQDGESADAARKITEFDTQMKSATVAGIVPYLPRLLGILDLSGAADSQETPFGLLRPPLGSARLKAAELAAAVMRVKMPAGEEGLIHSGAINVCLQLFMQFPFNNLLHQQVVLLVTCALEHGSDSMVDHLFGACRLASWLSSAPEEVRPLARPNDSKAESRPAVRAGYIGHLTRIANQVVASAEQRPKVQAHLDACPQWSEFASTTLRQRNDLQNVSSWACGRPSANDLKHSGSDDSDHVLSELDAIPEAGIPGRHLHRYGSFGEDDEDEEEGEASHGAMGSQVLSEPPFVRGAHDAFVSLHLDQADGSSSSSSSSDDSDDGISPPAGRADRKMGGIDDDAVVVTTDDEDEWMDDDAVVVGGNSPTKGSPGRSPKRPNSLSQRSQEQSSGIGNGDDFGDFGELAQSRSGRLGTGGGSQGSGGGLNEFNPFPEGAPGGSDSSSGSSAGDPFGSFPPSTAALGSFAAFGESTSLPSPFSNAFPDPPAFDAFPPTSSGFASFPQTTTGFAAAATSTGFAAFPAASGGFAAFPDPPAFDAFGQTAFPPSPFQHQANGNSTGFAASALQQPADKSDLDLSRIGSGEPSKAIDIPQASNQAEENKEFSTFNFWRNSPMQLVGDDDDMIVSPEFPTKEHQ